jgi:hypothetical protein
MEFVEGIRLTELCVSARAEEELREWMAVELVNVKTRIEKEMRGAVENEFQAKWSEKVMLKTSVETELRSEIETKFVGVIHDGEAQERELEKVVEKLRADSEAEARDTLGNEASAKVLKSALEENVRTQIEDVFVRYLEAGESLDRECANAAVKVRPNILKSKRTVHNRFGSNRSLIKTKLNTQRLINSN